MTASTFDLTGKYPEKATACGVADHGHAADANGTTLLICFGWGVCKTRCQQWPPAGWRNVLVARHGFDDDRAHGSGDRHITESGPG